MKPHPLSPDDPRLTAYALGEMPAQECAAFEALLAADPAARQVVDEIRAFTGTLDEALAHEPGPAAAPLPVEQLRSAAILPGGDRRKLDGGAQGLPSKGMGRVLRFPQMYYVTAGLAAACFAVFFIVQETHQAQPQPVPVLAANSLDNSPRARAADGMMVASAAPATAKVAEASLQLVSAEEPVSDRFNSTAEVMETSFPLHVGRESYRLVREQIRRGVRPAPSTVRVAEMVNAFTYRWPAPQAGEAFATILEEAAAPWAPEHRLVRIGLKGRDAAGVLLAQDARVRVTFNPAQVQAWRLIGYGRNGGAAGVRDQSAGVDLAPGTTVTALYELVPVAQPAKDAGSLLMLALGYTDPGSGESRTQTRELAAGTQSFEQAGADFRFAATVAAFGAQLQGAGSQPAVAAGELARWAHDSAEGMPEREEFAGLIPMAGGM
jgi:hypothetical protein